MLSSFIYQEPQYSLKHVGVPEKFFLIDQIGIVREKHHM